MQLIDFEHAVDRYGSDLSRWPTDIQSPARALVADNDAARALLEDAALLDSALDAYEVDPPSAALDARLLALAPKAARPAAQSANWKRWFDLRGLSIAGASFACAVFGLVVGYQSVEWLQTEDVQADAFLTASAYNPDVSLWTGEDG